MNLLLTGAPGVGKTTVLRRVLALVRVSAGGFFTEEIREDQERVGFKIVTTEAEEAILAHLRIRSPHRVGRYRVDVDAMERVAVPALERALRQADLIVIDEIAKMELFSALFKRVAVACLDSLKPVLGVIQRSRNPFLDRIRARSDVELVAVTPSGREVLPRQLADRVHEILTR